MSDFQTVYFCLSDKRFLNIIIKIFFEEDKSKGAFLGLFENDNILSSKSYTVTKSGLSPQRKTKSLRYLNLSSQDLS